MSVLPDIRIKFSLLLPLIISLIVNGSLFSQSKLGQVCGCDHTITLDDPYFNGEEENVLPGDIICIEAGSREQLLFKNVKGTKNNPVLITNSDGQVRINCNANYGIQTEYCEFFRISGAGVESHKYGIVIDGSNQASGGVGLQLQMFTQEFEIDHIEIHSTGFAGVMSKTEPHCGNKDLSWWTQYNSSFHDLYIHDTGGEGMYIGYSFPVGREVSCAGSPATLMPHDLVGVRIYNNIIDQTGWDGLQVGCAVEDVEIYGNKITNFGKQNIQYQRGGAQIGKKTTGRFYNNILMNGPAGAISTFGAGDNSFFNNLIVNTESGIYLNDTYLIEGKSYFRFFNNTFINSGGNSFHASLSKNVSCLFVNNLIVNPKADPLLLSSRVTANNNLIFGDISEALFADHENNDFHITVNSPAVDSGMDVSDYGILFDLDSLSRPVSWDFDIGAYEYRTDFGNSPPVIIAPESLTVDFDSITLLNVTCEDAENDSVNLFFEDLPSFVSISDTAGDTIIFSVFPDSADIGVYQIAIMAMDTHKALTIKYCTIIVYDPFNRDPEILSTDSVTLIEGQSIEIKIEAYDPDGDAVSIDSPDLPRFIRISDYTIDSAILFVDPGRCICH